MSAFMCSPETLYLISDYLFTLKHLSEMKKLRLIKKDPLSVERVDLFNLLYEMNKSALVERYGDENTMEMVGYQMLEGFAHARRYFGDKEELVSDTLLVYKMGCYLYQCAEGHIPESPLYMFLDRAMEHLALHAIRATKEYMDIPIEEWN